MRTLSAAANAAVAAVITSPGHLVEVSLLPTPARWSDIGQVTLGDGTTFAGVDMHVSGIGVNGDAPPAGFALEVANLDGAVGALMFANDVARALVTVYGFDRAAIAVADLVKLGEFSITQARIGIDTVQLTCAPVFYTAPFRRIDAANGFTHATPAGTKLVWGSDQLILDRLNSSHRLHLPDEIAMADFPRAIPIHMDSREATLDEAMVSRARSGRLRLRRLYASPVKEFRVVLKGLTNAERDTVQAFLTANRKAVFNFFWPYGAGLYQCVWSDSAIEWEDLGGHLSRAQVTFSVVT